MSEETEMDLDNAISAEAESIAAAMHRSPISLAEEAGDAHAEIVCSIRDRVIAGHPISERQWYVLAAYSVFGDGYFEELDDESNLD